LRIGPYGSVCLAFGENLVYGVVCASLFRPMHGVILSLLLFSPFTLHSALIGCGVACSLMTYPNCWILLEAVFANISVVSSRIRIIA